MDLEAWRTSQGLTYGQLAELLTVKSVSQMRRLCLGEELLRDERLAAAMALSGNVVTAFDVHERRMAFLRSRPEGIAANFADEEQSSSPSGSSGPVVEGKAA